MSKFNIIQKGIKEFTPDFSIEDVKLIDSLGRVLQLDILADMDMPPYDKSAMDVYIRFRTDLGKAGLLGIEAKYQEDLSDPPSDHKSRYDDPSAEKIGRDLPSVLKEISSRFAQEPLRHAKWYLLDKPMALWSWSMIQGDL